jgi:hypothetical protein
MGTNHYLQIKKSNGRCQDLHICKTSGGWSPSMRGYNKENHPWYEYDIRSWFEWKVFLRDQIQNKDGLIFDEYNDLLSYDEFVQKIESWQAGATCEGSGSKNHAECAINGEFGNLYEDRTNPEEIAKRKKVYWIDPEGYSFHDGDFS